MCVYSIAQKMYRLFTHKIFRTPTEIPKLLKNHHKKLTFYENNQ